MPGLPLTGLGFEIVERSKMMPDSLYMWHLRMKKGFFQFKITHELDSSFGLGQIVRLFSFHSEYWHIKTFKDFEIQSEAQARARIGAVRYVNRGLTHAKTFGSSVRVRVKPTGNSTSVYTIFK